MMKLKSLERFNTIFGTTFILPEENLSDGVSVNDVVIVDGVEYIVKKIIYSSKPNGKVSIVV